MNWTRRGCLERERGGFSAAEPALCQSYRQCHRYSFQTQLMAGSPPLIERGKPTY